MVYLSFFFILGPERSSSRTRGGVCRSQGKDGFNTGKILRKLTELEIVALNLDIYNI